MNAGYAGFEAIATSCDLAHQKLQHLYYPGRRQEATPIIADVCLFDSPAAAAVPRSNTAQPLARWRGSFERRAPARAAYAATGHGRTRKTKHSSECHILMLRTWADDLAVLLCRRQREGRDLRGFVKSRSGFGHLEWNR